MSTVTFPVQLLVRTHRDGSLTMRTLGSAPLTLWGTDPEAMREELELALWDRLERVHPRRLASFAAGAHAELLTVDVEDALLILGAPNDPGPLSLTVVKEPSGDTLALWLPALDARLWAPAHTDPTEAATELARELVAHLDPAERWALQHAGQDQLELLEVEATPAPLGAFFGDNDWLDMLPEPAHEEDEQDETHPKGGKKRPSTPHLGEVAQPLHVMACEGALARAHGRHAELTRLLRMLTVAAGPIVLVGPRGVGKSALLDELVHALADPEAPPGVGGREVWFADSQRLISGEGSFGGWQSKLFEVVRECIAADVIWYLGDVLPLLDAGKSIHSEQNVAEVLSPVLAGGQLRILAESSDEDWAEVELRNPGFARRFTIMRLDDPPEAEVRRIVAAVAAEQRGRIDVQPAATEAVVDLTKRYRTGLALLGGAVGMLRRVLDVARARGLLVVDRFMVVQHVCEETGLPPFLVRDDIPLKLADVRRHFEARILGQPHVVARMGDLVARIKAGVADDSRPLGSYLFVGPTGVGKTETVKALAALLFGSDQRISRFDMSEYAGPDCLDRLLGDGDAGLVARVCRSPFSVVLLDELEKAHAAVFDLLLQVLGEARLTDRKGRRADFRNTVILMTSNLGVDTFRRPTGFGTDLGTALSDHLLAAVHKHFRPELINRIDAVVGFAPLGPEPIAAITARELDKVRMREGLRSRDISLTLDDDVPSWLAARGVDLRYGARPLKRTIERALVAPMAHHLSTLSGQPPGLTVRVGDEGLEVQGAAVAEVAEQRRSELEDLLQTLSHARFRAGRWRACTDHTHARRRIATLDRLQRSRRFWHDEVEARRLLRASTAQRELLDTSDALWSHLQSLEDLAFEAWAGFIADPMVADELGVAVAEAMAQLADLEWSIAGIGHRNPHAATVWIAVRGEAALDEQPLALMYARLAHAHGWRVHGRSWLDDPLPQREIRAGKVEPDVAGICLRSPNGVSLSLEGRHAYTMLGPDTGQVPMRYRGRDLTATVRVTPGIGHASPPAPLERPRVVRRLDYDRQVFKDYELDQHRVPSHPHVALEGFLRDRLLARTFGRAAVAGLR